MVAIAIILLLSLAEVFTAGRLYLLFFFSLPRTYQQSHGPLHHHRLKLQLRLWPHVPLFPDLLPEGLFRHGGLLHPFLLLSPLFLRLLMPNLCYLMTWQVNSLKLLMSIIPLILLIPFTILC